MGDDRPAAEPHRRRVIGDGGTDAGNGGQAVSEGRGDPRSLAQGHVFVTNGHNLPSGHSGARSGVAFDRRLVLQGGLERHAAGHDEH